MAIRTIRWTVEADGMTLSPTTCLDGGVQGDHNKTRAEFVLPASLMQGYDLYIEYVDAYGEYDTTDKLTVSNGTVGVLLPSAWTQHGGEARLMLLAKKDGERGYTLAGKVRYHSRAGAFEKIKALIDGCIQGILGRIDNMVADFEAKLARGELKGDKGDKGDRGETGLVSFPDEYELFLDGGDAAGEIEEGEDEMAEYGTTEVIMTNAAGNTVDGTWHYQKWSSGLAECWGSFKKSVTPNKVWGNGTNHYYDFIESIPFPTDLFTKAPTITASLDDPTGSYFCTKANAYKSGTSDEFVNISKTQTGVIYVMSLESMANAVTVTVHFIAKGRWK